MDRGTAPGLRIALLGPVRAWRDGKPLSPGSPQQRALLAALLLRDGRTATADELIDALWGDEPPDSALAALRTYAFRLRKILGTDTLVSESGGYALRIAPDALDVSTARGHAAEAQKARAAGDLPRARELQCAALDLWDGEPLAGLPGPHAETHRARLAEWRLTLLETRLDIDLELGRQDEPVSELTALSAEYPLRERLRALLMLALYRSGRQAEALGVFADIRRLLADELGVDPSPELTDLHQRMLWADPELAVKVSVPRLPRVPVPVPVQVSPAQLPAAVTDFTGRETFVFKLVKELADAETGVIAVAGIGGVGKTALAVHVAHAARQAFPDDQLYADLEGEQRQPADPQTVLGEFLNTLRVPDEAVPESLQARANLYRSLLADRRVLVLLDNARDAAQVRPLLPGTPGSAALITSRARMVDLAGAHLIDLDVMSAEEALELFTRIVGRERVMAERHAAGDVVAACGFLPLAIRIAAARLAARRTWTVSFLARRLADERRRLDELRAGDLAVKATFELGYGQLDPEQARAFCLLALPDGPDISLEAAAAVLDMDPYDAEQLLETLVDTSLLESAAPARYRYHDLLRLYARDRARQDEMPESRTAALTRLLDYYLASATDAYELENPGDRALEHLVAPHRTGLVFTTRRHALEWLFSEAACLLAAIRQAASDGSTTDLRLAVDLLFLTQDLLESGIYARQYGQAVRALCRAADTCGEPLIEGRARVLQGRVHAWPDTRFAEADTEADTEAERALELGLLAGDPLTCSYAPNVRGLLAGCAHRYEDAAHYYQQALDAFRADGNQHGEAAALSNLSRSQSSLGDADAAITSAELAVAIYRRLGAGWRLGHGLYALAITLAGTGRHDEALMCFDEALQKFREARQELWEGMTLYRMADVHLNTGRDRSAASHADQALVVLSRNGSQYHQASALTVLGHALVRTGQRDRAYACLEKALRLFRALDSPHAADVQELIRTKYPGVAV